MCASDLRRASGDLRQLGQGGSHRQGRRGDQRGDQGLMAVVGRLEAVAGVGEVDRHEADAAAPRQRAEQPALVGQGLRQRRRQVGAERAVGERIGQYVAHALRIALVQAGLRHHHRPVRMRPARRGDHVEHHLLLLVHGLDDRQDQVRSAFAEGDVLRRVVGHLAEAAGVEKADDRRVLGEVEHARHLGAGAEAGAHLGLRALREHAHDRALAALHLADQPHHRRELARPIGDRRCRLDRLAHLASTLAPRRSAGLPKLTLENPRG